MYFIQKLWLAEIVPNLYSDLCTSFLQTNEVKLCANKDDVECPVLKGELELSKRYVWVAI